MEIIIGKVGNVTEPARACSHGVMRHFDMDFIVGTLTDSIGDILIDDI